MLRYLSIAATFFLWYASFAGGLQTIPAFPIAPNDLAVTRPAQADQYCDKIGPRAGLIGTEAGNFELWIWPWKVLRNLELEFLLGSSTRPISAKDIVRTVSVSPELTTITYSYESFSVREHILVPRNEPGALLLLEVHATESLSIIPGFLPVVQPMWPAGIGGQFSYWDDDMHGYVLSEGRWRAEFLCGSPGAEQMASPPAHMFADAPLQFRIRVEPGSADHRFIPIVLAGAVPDSATGRMTFDSVKSVYTRLWQKAETYYAENRKYYDLLRSSTIRITTPDPEVNLAGEWGKVALDNLMVINPKLGKGLVAGYGMSGNGERPGFAWFFGGDAFINSLAIDGYGATASVRDALLFTQKWQRGDNFPVRKKNPSDPPADVGKMAHELSQSDGLCDWWNDYHYGYNHADTSPWYIVATADYVRTSGDTAFLRQSWPSLCAAYAWCLSKDSDNDGLMDLKGAGLGALEFGKLVGIYADAYTCGVFVQSIRDMHEMSLLTGDTSLARRTSDQYRRAAERMEKLFWMGDRGYYSYGATQGGEQVGEKTPWPGVAMMFGLLDRRRTGESLEATNGADICTDWGVRSLSDRSSLFDPVNYNYGAVWPFISSFYNTAQFGSGFSTPAYRLLKATMHHAFDHAVGVVPEVFSGALNEKLSEGYHHQGFSTTGYLLPLIRGLAGLRVEALTSTIRLDPHIPAEWDRFEIGNIRAGGGPVDLLFQRTEGGWDIRMSNSGRLPVHLQLGTSFLPETRIENLQVSRASGGGSQIPVRDGSVGLDLAGTDTLRIRYTAGPSLVFPPVETSAGAQNEGLKIIRERYDPERRRIDVTAEGTPGSTYTLGLVRPELVESVQGVESVTSGLLLRFPADKTLQFVRKEFSVLLKP